MFLLPFQLKFEGFCSPNPTSTKSVWPSRTEEGAGASALCGYAPWRSSPRFGVELQRCRSGLWDQGVYSHFCDTRESPPLYRVLVFGKPFLLYHRSGHFPQPCSAVCCPDFFLKPGLVIVETSPPKPRLGAFVSFRGHPQKSEKFRCGFCLKPRQ